MTDENLFQNLPTTKLIFLDITITNNNNLIEFD